MAKPVYIVQDDHDNFAVGSTVREAWDAYERDIDYTTLKDCTFYRAEEIKVELEVREVPTEKK